MPLPKAPTKPATLLDLSTAAKARARPAPRSPDDVAAPAAEQSTARSALTRAPVSAPAQVAARATSAAQAVAAPQAASQTAPQVAPQAPEIQGCP